MPFQHYIALGDSMSIDLYPALDAGETDVAVALERVPTAGRVAPLGAASLFYRNDETLWPESVGNDLSSWYPGIRFQSLASTGATIGDVFGEQLPMVTESHERTLVTLTIGSEDLFSAFSAKPKRALLERIVTDLIEAYDMVIGAIQRARPDSLVLITTILDPSDRLGQIAGVLEDVGKLPLFALDTINNHLRMLAANGRGLALADPYVDFLGHGATVWEEERWYWRRAPLELNARGARAPDVAGRPRAPGEQRRVTTDAVRSPWPLLERLNAASGPRLAVATLVSAAGSTPKKAGAKMWLDATGAIAGTVTIGGCVDARVPLRRRAVPCRRGRDVA